MPAPIPFSPSPIAKPATPNAPPPMAIFAAVRAALDVCKVPATAAAAAPAPAAKLTLPAVLALLAVRVAVNPLRKRLTFSDCARAGRNFVGMLLPTRTPFNGIFLMLLKTLLAPVGMLRIIVVPFCAAPIAVAAALLVAPAAGAIVPAARIRPPKPLRIKEKGDRPPYSYSV